MIAGADRQRFKSAWINVPDFQCRSLGITERQVHHLVEITIEDIALPADIDCIAAHQALDCSRIECLL